MAVQSIGLAQVTLETTSAFCGDAAADQVAPASLVVTTTPLPGSDAPLEPTAMHSVAVGQDTPLSCGVLPPATCCAFHVTPPLLVAAITVAPLGGRGIGAGHTDGPAAAGRGARQRSEVAGAAGGRLAHRQGGALGLTEDARDLR